LAAFLCTAGASYITGQNIWVDGGMISRLGGLRL
jgi:NAD(P)-dependent dehydrogenase (short-subunit alcohol dehydrogenase family)